MDYHKSVDRRRYPHVLYVSLGLIHRQARFVTFFFADGECRFVGRTVRPNVLLELRQGAFGFVKRENVFLSVDLA
jgi:hypothetical protein